MSRDVTDFSTLIGSINRQQHNTLAQKRILRDIARISKQQIDQVAANVPDTAEVYGGTLLYGSVIWLQDLDFEVTACSFIIDGVTYEAGPASITLDAADVTHPRIDVIYVDTSGNVGFVAGTPAADPAKPEVDANTQLELTFVTVAATATTPTNTGATTLYAEDAGDPTEWDATENTSTARITLADTTDPYAGTKHITFGSTATTGDAVTLTAGSAVTVGDIDSVEVHIKPVSFANRRELRVAFFSGANRVSAWVAIKNGNFGFDSTNTGAYQTLGLDGNLFSFSAATADSIVFEVAGKNGDANFYLDNIRFQTGGGTTIVNNYIGLTEDEMINNVREWNVQQPFGNGTLTDGATITWDLDTDPVANVTLGGDRTLNFINARAGGTYILKVAQDVIGTRLITWDADVEWPAGTAPTLTTTASGYDVFSFVAFDDTTLVGTTAGLEFS